MMERMFKRVGLTSGQKSVDTENDGNVERDSADCRNVLSSAAGDRSPGSGDLQWCDLLSFKNVCSEPTAHDSAGDIDDQLGGYDGVTRRPRRLRVFNFPHIDTHIMEFKPRALTRRLCGGRKQDNELYRSNSFKFERFERVDEGVSLQKQISLCDEYSLPVDFVNKRRPHSFVAGLTTWTTPSPSGDQVEVVGDYSDPRDSKAYLEPGAEASGKLYTSPDRDYSQHYTVFLQM